MPFDVDVRCQRGGREIAAKFSTGPGVTAVFGPSGIGKTTVLNVVAGLLPATRGHVIVGGEDISALPPERRLCGYIFQDGRLFPHLSVRANLNYGAKRAAAGGAILSFEAMLEMLGAATLLERAPRTLSGGEAQRVAIGRALLSAPRFLIMDEPISSLDAPRREEIMRIIEHIRDDLRLPILYVSHDRAEVDRLANHVVEMV